MKKVYLILLFQITLLAGSLGQKIKHFDAGRGTVYEILIAKLTFSCLTRYCKTDVLNEFKTKDFLDKRFKPDKHFESELAEIKDKIRSNKTSKYLGIINVLGEPNLTFTKTIFDVDEMKIIAQIELKLFYIGGVLKVKSIKFRDSSQFKNYEEWDVYLISRKKDEYNNIPPPPVPPMQEQPIFRFNNLVTYPNLCDCYENDIYVDNRRKYHLKNKEYEQLQDLNIGTGYSTDFLIATIGSKKGLIDYDNNIIIPIKYQNVKRIGDDLTLLVKDNDKHGVLNIKNEIIVPIEYDEIYIQRYHNTKEKEIVEFFVVKENGKYGIYNNKGMMILPTKYEEIYFLISRYIRVKQNNLYGIFDANGKELLPPIYDEINPVFYSLETLQKGEKSILIPDQDSSKTIKFFKVNPNMD
ncbi:MAG: WG repeat-containing protein [Saprospiraceae bacterium]|nr:WG repeat-containing protein [Saprospiraceae bacterium]MCB9326574.1 WG repeat-containing protein [Lewinellaceae bacterium]